MLIYSFKFYSVLKHRMRNCAGEIDIICQRGKHLVFVEVKARKDKVDDILCTSFQQNKIRKAAEIYLASNPKYRDFDLRFDLVVVRPWQWPQIIKNAW
jgi:putative endonuclease